jgi:serine protease Do
VARGSPAEQGGLQPGDLVLSVNDRTVYDGEDLVREVGLLGPGEFADLKIYRPRSRSFGVLRVQLGKWPVQDDSLIIASHKRYQPWNGLQIDYSTSRRRYMTSAFLAEYVRAVVITEVAPNSPAAGSQLEPGLFITEVNGVPVESPAEFYAALPEGSSKVELTLLDNRRVTLEGTVSP